SAGLRMARRVRHRGDARPRDPRPATAASREPALAAAARKARGSGAERGAGVAAGGRTQHAPLRLRLRGRAASFVDLGASLFRLYPRRAILGLSLIAAQAFCYNAIFFTYALVLGRFYSVAPEDVGHYLLPFAASNFLGPLLLGRWFDTWGRRRMIAGTY